MKNQCCHLSKNCAALNENVDVDEWKYDEK